MLTNYNEPQKQTLVLVNGELHATEKSNRKINNIQQWTDAFLIFSSVYLQAHPAKNLELLKYMVMFVWQLVGAQILVLWIMTNSLG